jgi:hypothetical protein
VICDKRRYHIGGAAVERDFLLDDLTFPKIHYIIEILKRVEPNHEHIKSILDKLNDPSDLILIANSLVRQQADNNIKQLKESIRTQKQVLRSRKKGYKWFIFRAVRAPLLLFRECGEQEDTCFELVMVVQFIVSSFLRLFISNVS